LHQIHACLGRQRCEFDASQELNYPAIAQAIKATEFDGFIGQEYVPTSEDPFQFLPTAVKECSA